MFYRYCLACLALALWFCGTGVSLAHFQEGTKPRTILIADDPEGGVTAFIRIPAPLLYVREIVAAQADQVPFEAEFLETRRVGNALTFLLSQTDIDAAPEAFAARLASAHEWQQNGRPVAATVLRWRLYDDRPDSAFSSAEDARAALTGPGPVEDPNFGTTYIDFELHLDAPMPRAELALRSALPFLPLPDNVTIDNHIRDVRGDHALPVTEPGQLQNWVRIDGSTWRAVGAFVWQGIVHILVGLDHVFLVICIGLAAGGLMRLVSLVSAFTIGHAVTLVAAFLGYVPQVVWFIPAVETGIAVTVVYAAAAAYFGRLEAPWVMGAVGLLHGLGFSFVLSEILGPGAPGLLFSLASFTVGIELGQLAILAVTLLVSWGLTQASGDTHLWARRATLSAITMVAAYWALERAYSLI